MSNTLFVKANAKAGFRRAGIFFPSEGISIDVSELSEAQLEAIENEPKLTHSESEKDINEVVPTELLEDIVEAIAILDPDKKPNVKEVEEVLSKDINANQRDQAWAVYQERLAQA